MYCALSGLDQDNKKDSTTFNDIRPCIGELSTLDTMLTIQNYIFPENLPTKYSINADASQIVGFSSSGYMLCDYAEGSKIPKGITTFNLRGDTLCKFILADAKDINVSPDTITRFQTFLLEYGSRPNKFLDSLSRYGIPAFKFPLDHPFIYAS